MNEKLFSNPLPIGDVRVTGHFWKDLMETARTKVIPYQWEALNDRIEGAAPSYCMRNFHAAAGKIKAEFGGCVFQDSDVAKWLEAVAYSLMWHPDPELEKIADGAIDDIVAAQQPDGYLDTYYILNGLDKRFTNLKDHHELYCLGHMIEGAVAYYQATGKDKLLKALERYVDCVDEHIGPDEGKIHGYPGHEIIEMALIRLYEVTKKEKYLRLAKYFIDERGKSPLYFEEETKKYGNKFWWDESSFQYHYYQAGEPVRDQQYAIGHAVRAVYLYSGVADVARRTGDETLYETCRRLWNDTVNRQMYVTGGIGSSQYGEAFTYDYDLPNDTIYAETCASIGLVFFARRMLGIEPRGEYGDVMERALYNGIISGMSQDGRSFFYVNPLEVVPEASEKDHLRHHVKVQRQKWFGCACCPPNLARLLCSMGAYSYGVNGDTLYTHLYLEGDTKAALTSGELSFSVKTNYPWDGDVRISMQSAPSAPVTLALRIPGWCRSYTLKVAGETITPDVRDGYAYITRTFAPGEEIELVMEMPVRLVRANPRVREDIGKVALMRGPIVYCLEEADNGDNLARVYVDANASFSEHFDPDFFGGAMIIESKGEVLSDDGWNADTLYQYSDEAAPAYTAKALRWIPYYLWANRTPGEMTVWVRVKG